MKKPKMGDKTQEKLEGLETLIAHQSKEIADLNEVVTEQAKEIDTLKQYIKIKLSKLETSIEEIGENEHKSVSDEALANKPPHY